MWLQRLPPNKEARVYKKRKGGYHFRTNCSNFSTDKLNRITKLILVHFSTQYSQIFLINEYLVSDPLPWSDVIWWFCSNGQDKSVKSRVSRHFLSCFVCHCVSIAGICPGLVISWYGVMSCTNRTISPLQASTLSRKSQPRKAKLHQQRVSTVGWRACSLEPS